MAQKKTNWLKALRADISAVLLIAFVFQLIFPIAVLASDPDVNDEFETALRYSICQVQTDLSADGTNAADGFVCDWCVLCTMDAPPASGSLPEAAYLKHTVRVPHVLHMRDTVTLRTQIAQRPAAPRAPPAV